MHYVVQVMLEHGLYMDFVFFTFEEANEYYIHLDRKYKKLLSVSMDGTRTVLSGTVHSNNFQYTGIISDIKSVPCRKLKLCGTEAYAHLLTSILQYKQDEKSKLWKLIAVHGIENEYEYSY